MRLVIAEKPSVAMSIAAVLGVKDREEGCISGKEYIVSWCYGHLAELADPAVYDERYAKWRLEDLPILPGVFQYTLRPDGKNQFEVLRALMDREDVTEVINACDAGREGELIFRTVYHLAGCTKPILRLWVSSMEDSAIRDGFRSLWPGSEYDGLYKSALCRAKADWLVGINATRFFSLLYGLTLNVGRVVSPTLALLVQREAEIAAFEPEPFYTVQLDCGFPAATERMKEKAEAIQIADSCQGTATVRTVERREKTEKPPALYDLTSLQRDANRILGYTAQQTLDYLQALYEKKLCTYPRTDSRYLTNDMEANVPEYVAAAALICSMTPPKEIRGGQVCNSQKVSDHHAVIPTASVRRQDVDSLPIGEREILSLVAKRLLSAVSDSHRYTETTVILDCGGHTFTGRGKTVLDAGWKAYDQMQKETFLPDLSEGQALSITNALVKGGQTSPPKHYTEDTILSSMENPGATEMPGDAERKGIGTPATRAGILEKLVSSGFVERRKSKKVASLIPTDIGTALISVLPEQLQSPQLTAEWEQRLKEIDQGDLAVEDFLSDISDMLRELVQSYQPVPNAHTLFPPEGEILGLCPRCGKRVMEHKQGFFCEDRRCGFALWKNSKFFSAKRKQLTKETAAALLRNGRVKLTGCYSPKTGKTYDTVVLLNDDGKQVSFTMEFGKDR